MVTDYSYHVSRCLGLGSLALGSIIGAHAQDEILPLTESKIIEVVNSVQVLTGEELEAVPAVTDMLFQAPDFLETGRRSRARLKAEDGTITRIGSNTLFSFDDASRTINLKRGSLLFHSPEGRGGGRVVTASATASVIGTTIIVAATDNGGFKMLVLEGVANIAYPDGTIRQLTAGQMTFVMPDTSSGGNSGNSGQGGNQGGGQSGGSSGGGGSTGGTPGPVVNFDLERLQEGSGLLNGFSTTLPSAPKIQIAIEDQQVQINEGGLESTGAIIVGAADGDTLQIITSDSGSFRDSNPLLSNSTDEDGNLVPDRENGPPDQGPPDPTTDELLESALSSSVNLSRDGFAEENVFGFPWRRFQCTQCGRVRRYDRPLWFHRSRHIFLLRHSRYRQHRHFSDGSQFYGIQYVRTR